MLTVKQIDAAKPKDKPYRLLDANGLYLYVPVSGKKVWQLRYKLAGKEKILTVGKYPLMSLQEARDKAYSARKDVSDGVDPVAAKRKATHDNSFSYIYKEWFEHKKQVWSDGYATELARMFTDDILPMLGNIEISDIEPMQVLAVIRRFESRGAMDRANKARQRCGEVFRYAIITGRAKYNPAPDLADAMKGYRKKNYPFLPADQIPGFNSALSGYTGSVISRIATQVLQYTAMRTKEMRSMQWSNVDFENRMITIEEGV
ncbi:tyrosine-type recombinase/integrase, partial [Escherichia coli]